MAVASVITRAKLLADRLAPGLAAAWQRRKLHRALAARRRPLPRAARSEQRPVVLFFAPEALIAPHFATHVVLARTLKELGHAVLIVRCFGHLAPRCVAMQAVTLPVAATVDERARVCESCVRRSLAMVDAYGLDVVDLADIVDEPMRAELGSLMAAAPADLREFNVAGVRVGALANGDLSRMLKVNDPAAIAGEPRELVRQYTESAVLAYLAVRRLCERLNVARFVYFNDYAMTVAAAAAAETEKVPTTHLSHTPLLNNDRRKIVMLTGYAPLEGPRRLREWAEWRDLALYPERVAMISDDSFLRFAGSGFTIYSPAWTAASEGLFERLSLDRRRRLLVAYTSSEDEIRAQRFYEQALGVEIFPGVSAFADQFDWLQSLVDWVEASDDLQLVVRVHPREAPNHRESRTSQNLWELQRRFSGSYRHVRVVWPQDPVSSYDLAEIADAALIALSSIGIELVRLGVPVVAALRHLAEAPPGVFVEWGGERRDYYATVRRALDGPPSLSRAITAFRWINARQIEYAVDFGDVIPTPDYPGLPPFAMPREASVAEEVLIGGRLLSEINHERLRRAQIQDSAERERAAIIAHFRSFMHFLVLGKRLERNEPPGGAAAIVHERKVTLVKGDRQVTKFSPMAARLAALAAGADTAVDVA